jgi:hypothetical protein
VAEVAVTEKNGASPCLFQYGPYLKVPILLAFFLFRGLANRQITSQSFPYGERAGWVLFWHELCVWEVQAYAGSVVAARFGERNSRVIGGAMQGKILVAMQGRDRPEEIIPYLENLARPGMRVIFLLRYPVKLWSYLRDHWVDTESARKAQLAGQELAERYSREAQIAIAEDKIAPARAALREKPITVEVELYTGNLQSKVLEHTVMGDVDWIILPAPRTSWLLRLLGPASARSGGFEWARSLPVMLFSPKFLAERQARLQSVTL